MIVMANSDILNAIEITINEALKSEELTIEGKATLQALRYLVAFSKESSEDHQKILVLWPAYQIGKWAMAIILAIGITDLATRFLALIGK